MKSINNNLTSVYQKLSYCCIVKLIGAHTPIETIAAKIAVMGFINECWTFRPDAGFTVWIEIKRRRLKKGKKFKFSCDGINFVIWRIQ